MAAEEEEWGESQPWDDEPIVFVDTQGPAEEEADPGYTSDRDADEPRVSQEEHEVVAGEERAAVQPYSLGAVRTLAELRALKCPELHHPSTGKEVQKAYRLESEPVGSSPLVGTVGGTPWYAFVPVLSDGQLPPLAVGRGRPGPESIRQRGRVKVASVAAAVEYESARLAISPLNPLLIGPQPGIDFEPELEFPLPVDDWPFKSAATRGPRWEGVGLAGKAEKLEVNFTRRTINIFSSPAIRELYAAARSENLLVEVDVTPAHLQRHLPKRAVVSTSMSIGEGKGQFTASRAAAPRAYCEFVLYKGTTAVETGDEPNSHVQAAFATANYRPAFYDEPPAAVKSQIAGLDDDAKVARVNEWLDTLNPLEKWVYIAEHRLTLTPDLPKEGGPPKPPKWKGGRGKVKSNEQLAAEEAWKAWQAKGKGKVGEGTGGKRSLHLWEPCTASFQAKVGLSYIVWRHKRELICSDNSVRLARFPPAVDLSHRAVLFETTATLTAWRPGWQVEEALAERQPINNSRISCVTHLWPITRTSNGSVEYIPPSCQDSESLCPHKWAPCWGPCVVAVSDLAKKEAEAGPSVPAVGPKEAPPSGKSRAPVSGPLAKKRRVG